MMTHGKTGRTSTIACIVGIETRDSSVHTSYMFKVGLIIHVSLTLFRRVRAKTRENT